MRPFLFCTFILLIFLIVSYGNAKEEYAEKTGKSCAYCHLDQKGGGELTKAGDEFLSKLIEGEKQGKVIQTYRRIPNTVRLIAGYLHILTAFLWLGTIFYVHLILKPAYAARGLPRGEVRLGLVSMAVMAVTGTILSYSRVPTLSFLFETRFGILLIIKIVLFLILSLSGLFVVFFIGPKLREKKESTLPKKGDLTTDDLMFFDGAKGRASYFAYKGKIFDVTASEHWKNGIHFAKHCAGIDLTEMLKQAPHGEERILEMPEIGKIIFNEQESMRLRHQKLFYIMAYLNLALVFLIILILALWRWW